MTEALPIAIVPSLATIVVSLIVLYQTKRISKKSDHIITMTDETLGKALKQIEVLKRDVGVLKKLIENEKARRR